MIRHVLLYKFRAKATRQERCEALEMLKSLKSCVPGVREWSIGEQAFPSEKAFDIAQISSFESVEALDRYRDHPEHIKTREFLSRVADWVVVDYEFSGESET